MKKDESAGAQPQGLKEAKYWQEFSAATRTEAERAAAAWWAEQRGLVKVSGWILPLEAEAPGHPQWTVTIIYKTADQDRAGSTLH
jgi:hypothetical protein